MTGGRNNYNKQPTVKDSIQILPESERVIAARLSNCINAVLKADRIISKKDNLYSIQENVILDQIDALQLKEELDDRRMEYTALSRVWFLDIRNLATSSAAISRRDNVEQAKEICKRLLEKCLPQNVKQLLWAVSVREKTSFSIMLSICNVDMAIFMKRDTRRPNKEWVRKGPINNNIRNLAINMTNRYASLQLLEEEAMEVTNSENPNLQPSGHGALNSQEVQDVIDQFRTRSYEQADNQATTASRVELPASSEAPPTTAPAAVSVTSPILAENSQPEQVQPAGPSTTTGSQLSLFSQTPGENLRTDQILARTDFPTAAWTPTQEQTHQATQQGEPWTQTQRTSSNRNANTSDNVATTPRPRFDRLPAHNQSSVYRKLEGKTIPKAKLVEQLKGSNEFHCVICRRTFNKKVAAIGHLQTHRRDLNDFNITLNS